MLFILLQSPRLPDVMQLSKSSNVPAWQERRIFLELRDLAKHLIRSNPGLIGLSLETVMTKLLEAVSTVRTSPKGTVSNAYISGCMGPHMPASLTDAPPKIHFLHPQDAVIKGFVGELAATLQKVKWAEESVSSGGAAPANAVLNLALSKAHQSSRMLSK